MPREAVRTTYASPEPHKPRQTYSGFMSSSKIGSEVSVSQQDVRENSKKQDANLEESDDLPCEWGDGCAHLTCCDQWFRNSKCVLIWLCLASVTQGMCVNGFVNSSITSLEKRHGLQSLESGAIASFYDIGSLLCLIPVTYIGGTGRKPRWVAIGLFIMGLGSLIYAVPQFISGKYVYATPIESICYNSSTIYPNFCSTIKASQSSNYKYVFYLGQFLHGVGASPLYTLAVAYLDDNLSTADAGLYLGIYYCMSLVGPALGYLLGGTFLNIYVDVGSSHPGLEQSNTALWIGAWWVGFLICTAMAWTGVIPTFGFPKVLPGSNEIRAAKKDESYERKVKSKDNEAENTGIKKFCDSLRVILCNPTFICISISGAIESQLVAGFSTFGPKMLETLYSLEASWATMLMGITTIPAGGSAMLLSGIIIKVTNMSMRRTLWTVVICSAASLVAICCFLIKCEGGEFVGISEVSGKPNNLTFGCNMNCNCKESKFMYSPVCGLDKKMYFSACYAGCKTNFTGSDNIDYYADCACIKANGTIHDRSYSAKAGSCSVTNCNLLAPFLFVFAILIFATFFIATPSLSATIRSVPEEQKSLALGVQWIIIRTFGSIPAPIYFGVLIDNTCSLWSGGCGTAKGSCSRYNGVKLQQTLLAVGFVGKFLSVAMLLLAALLYRNEEHPDVNDKTEGSDSNNEHANGSTVQMESYTNPSYIESERL